MSYKQQAKTIIFNKNQTLPEKLDINNTMNIPVVISRQLWQHTASMMTSYSVTEKLDINNAMNTVILRQLWQPTASMMSYSVTKKLDIHNNEYSYIATALTTYRHYDVMQCNGEGVITTKTQWAGEIEQIYIWSLNLLQLSLWRRCKLL